MKFLRTRNTLPWLCAGDFNEILDATEQFGGLVRPESQMDGFQDVVEVCGFADLGFSGLPWTWDNRQDGDRNVKVWLDRGLATANFLDLFRDITVRHVQTTESDHCCLVIECYRKDRARRTGQKQFRYENMWKHDPSYLAMVREVCEIVGESNDLMQLQTGLGQVRGAMQD